MQFRYLKDPLFLFCLALYFANRWVLKPYFHIGLFKSYLNDVICLPFWVPIMVFAMRKLRLRKEDSPPAASEILIPLLIWSWVFEAYLPFTPYFKGLATSDYKDILAYTAGGLWAAAFWRYWYGKSSFVTLTKLNAQGPSSKREGAALLS